jgi:hypothetical protein
VSRRSWLDGKEGLSKEPLDVQSLRKMIRGYFVGDVHDFAAPDQEYPLLRWSPSIDRLWWDEDAQLQWTTSENMKVIGAKGVGFRPKHFEVYGRGKAGRQPLDLGTIDVATEGPQDNEPP